MLSLRHRVHQDHQQRRKKHRLGTNEVLTMADNCTTSPPPMFKVSLHDYYSLQETPVAKAYTEFSHPYTYTQ